MRIALNYYNESSGCEDRLLGEVEDYTIILVPNPLHQRSNDVATAQKTTINNIQKKSNQGLRSTPPKRKKIIENSIVDIFTLHPNPANDIVLFNFTLNSESSSEGSIVVYDILGRVVKRLEKTFTKGINKLNVKESLQKGTEMSSNIIQKIGARLD